MTAPEDQKGLREALARAEAERDEVREAFMRVAEAIGAPASERLDVEVRSRFASLIAGRDAAVADQRAMLVQVGEHARARGEAEGALLISEKAGIVEGWRDRARAAEAERDATAEKNEQLRFEVEALTQRNDELKQDAEDAETILQGVVAVTAARDAAEAEITRLKEGMEAAPLRPEVIAAAWKAWHARHGGKLGPGPAFVEALRAGLACLATLSPKEQP